MDLLTRFIHTVRQTGIGANKNEITNFYVSLKTRPLIILSGSLESQKEVLIQCLARLLFGKDCVQCQMLTGHPWWAEKTGNSPFFVQIHTSFNSQKIYYLLEEASQPENAQRLFLASLTHISSAELLSFFADVGYQIQHDEIVRFGDMHLPEPMPFPPNLSLIGTMDGRQFEGWSQDLLAGATVIHWEDQIQGKIACPISENTLYSGEKVFLRSCIRDISAAFRYLQSISGWQQRSPFKDLFEVKSIIEQHGMVLPPRIINDVILYMANTWSLRGEGLFDTNPSVNFAIALDYAIAQMLLPWTAFDSRDPIALFQALESHCSIHFPVSYQQTRRLQKIEPAESL